MDYAVDKLDECIFDYLTFHMDTPKHLNEIFNDIKSESGYRCSELKENELLGQFKCFNVCYTLDSNYKNIFKIFDHNTLYLVYTVNSDLQMIKDKLLYIRNPHNHIECHNDASLVSYIIKFGQELQPNVNYVFTGSIIEYYVKTKNDNLLQKLMDLWVLNINDQMKILKLVLHNSGNSTINLILDTYSPNVNELENYEFNKFEIQFVKLMYELQISNNKIKDLTVAYDSSVSKCRELSNLLNTTSYNETRLRIEYGKLNSWCYLYSRGLLLCCAIIGWYYFTGI
jgi:hypothetical protein